MITIGVLILAQGLVCAVFCMVVGDAKGYDGGKWGAAGFFFGVFALAAVVGMPLAKDNESWKRQQTPADVKAVEVKAGECPRCHAMNEAGANWCRECNTRLMPGS